MLTELYARLPPTLQSVAASLRGYKLRAWRYGPGSDRLVAEALERDGWSAAAWERWTEERLARLLHRAATRVPYYREQWAARRRRGDTASVERLENWPILKKAALREAPRAFVADDCDIRRMMQVETSGTTGTPLALWRSRATETAWYAIVEARLRAWNGVSRHDRWSNLGGQRVTAGGRRNPPFWVWNAPMHQLYLSSYHVAPANVPAYLEALSRYRIRYVLGYPSAMHALARIVLERKREAPRLDLFLSNAEPLLRLQRDAIREAFRCRVVDTYGQGEIVCAASECGSGTLHLWPDVGVTEWIGGTGGEPAVPGGSGDLVCTGLVNPDMPLIRYAVGDRARRPRSETRCACGRSLPVLEALEGRTSDLIRTPDGTTIGGLDTVFHSGLPMHEAQIVQESLKRFRINVVPAAGFGEAHRQDLVRGVRARIGHEVDVDVVLVESIPRTSAGKFRVQVSMIEGSGP